MEKYGHLALIAGASEGIGAAFADALASNGMDVILVARREAPLLKFKQELQEKYAVQVDALAADLGDADFDIAVTVGPASASKKQKVNEDSDWAN